MIGFAVSMTARRSTSRPDHRDERRLSHSRIGGRVRACLPRQIAATDSGCTIRLMGAMVALRRGTNSVREERVSWYRLAGIDMVEEPAGLRHLDLRSLCAFWLKQCPEGGLPLATDMEPSDLRRWLPNLLIMHVHHDGSFSYSYYGRSLARAFGETRLGQTLDDLPESARDVLRQEYELVCRQRSPIHRTYTATFDGERQTWERLVLPLSSDGQTIDKLLVAAYEL